eukprot:4010646-Pleurochrysis_carterae.AAC.1
MRPGPPCNGLYAQKPSSHAYSVRRELYSSGPFFEPNARMSANTEKNGKEASIADGTKSQGKASKRSKHTLGDITGDSGANTEPAAEQSADDGHAHQCTAGSDLSKKRE